MKIRISRGGVTAALLLAAAMAWAPAQAMAQPAFSPPKIVSDDPCALPSAADGVGMRARNDAATPAIPKGAPADANPFAYILPSDSKGFMPAMEGDIPSGIIVQGIICLEGKASLAALLVPGYGEPFYVKEDDVIALRQPNGKKGDGLVYIQVGEVGPQEVELYPRTNPSNIHILR